MHSRVVTHWEAAGQLQVIECADREVEHPTTTARSTTMGRPLSTQRRLLEPASVAASEDDRDRPLPQPAGANRSRTNR